MSQRAKRSISAILLSTALAFCALAAPRLLAGDADSDSDPPAFTLPAEHEVLLMRAGLTPEAFAAAGVTSLALSAQLAEAESDLSTALTALGVADAAYGEARPERDRLQRLVRSGQGSEDDVVALVQAKAAVEAAEEARLAAVDSAFAAATSELTQPQVAALTQVRANDRWRWCPTPYRVLSQDQEGWIALRDALAAVKTHADFELDPPAECSDHLDDLDDLPAVAAAQARSDAHLPSIQALWDATFVE